MSPAPAALRDAAATRTDDQRSDRRLKVFRVGRVDAAPHEARCHILNLSAKGALIDCHLTLPKRSDVLLATGDFARDAVVRWREGTRVGVAFRSPLTEGELDRSL